VRWWQRSAEAVALAGARERRVEWAWWAAKAERARCVDGPAQKNYFNRLGCLGEMGQNTVLVEKEN
jgi:hypothetical protein